MDGSGYQSRQIGEPLLNNSYDELIRVNNLQVMYISNGIQEYHYNLWNATAGDLALAMDNRERNRLLDAMGGGMIDKETYNKLERQYKHLTGFKTMKQEFNIPKGENPWHKT